MIRVAATALALTALTGCASSGTSMDDLAARVQLKALNASCDWQLPEGSDPSAGRSGEMVAMICKPKDIDLSPAESPSAEPSAREVGWRYDRLWVQTIPDRTGTLVRDKPFMLYRGGLTFESVRDSADIASAFAGQDHGLLGTGTPGGFVVETGAQDGFVPFTIRVLEDEPTVGRSWDDIVESSFTPRGDDIRVGTFDGYPVLFFHLHKGTTYRVRYSGVGLDAGSRTTWVTRRSPVDRYLVEIWPAPSRPDVVLKQTSRVALDWHVQPRTH